MTECEATKKFRTVLQHLGLNEKVKDIDFCENKLCGVPGKVEALVEYRITLDKLLLTDPAKQESEWTDRMAGFPDGVVPCLPQDDRIFLVFLHELGHIVHGDCLKDPLLEDSQEADEQEQKAWNYAWTVYRAYSAGLEPAD